VESVRLLDAELMPRRSGSSRLVKNGLPMARRREVVAADVWIGRGVGPQE
jgi:hypothetical protein